MRRTLPRQDHHIATHTEARAQQHTHTHAHTHVETDRSFHDAIETVGASRVARIYSTEGIKVPLS